MIVEDEPDVYDLLLATVEMWGHGGEAFPDGEEAVAWIDHVDHSRSHRPDSLPELALLDIRLPGEISGPMVGARLRQSHRLKDIAIVLITAYKLSVEEEQSVIQQAGADLLLYKPLPSYDRLKRMLEDLIIRQR
jgi:CheY-like chemotaxis protein